ncbi:MAG: alpha/beta fold hydrolase [Alphaproteobacteria bacterium]|nr:alpha/beta fold hydrolase [Alphaproteobacteria bacterium]
MKPPVLMIHGAFVGGWSFERLADHFAARGHEVHAPDLRHHDLGPRGKPPAALGTTGVRDYVDDLKAIAARLSGPPILVGHSMGGLLAQILAAEIPAAAAILLAPSAPWGVLPSTQFEIAQAQGLYMAGNFWTMPLKPRFWIAAAHALDRMPEAERHAIFARFVPESGRAMFEILHWAMDTSHATMVHARDIECPILVLVGTEDRINHPRTVKRVAQRYGRRASYREFPGMSHWLIAEPGVEIVAHTMTSWLEKVLGASEAEKRKAAE